MRRAEHQPITEALQIYAGVYVKLYRIQDAGTTLPQHAHAWPHQTMVCSGAVYLERDGEPSGRFDAPALIRIPEKIKHTFMTLAPNTVLACIHGCGALEGDEPVVAVEHQIVTED